MIQNEGVQESLLSTVLLLIFLLGISLLFVWKIAKKGFFKVSLPVAFNLIIRGKDVLRGFFYFLGAELTVVLGGSFLFYNWHLSLFFSKEWISLASMYAGACGVTCAYFALKTNQRYALWNQRGVSWYQAAKEGLINLSIFYFPVILLSSLLSLLISHFFKQQPQPQQAIEFLLQAKKNPVLFCLTITSVILLAPFKEEFLFRALLQSWIKKKTTSSGAIVLTSFIFALFHYSPSQELSNISLLCSLFILSCGLGFIFEKEGSIAAPLAMHAAFNASQILLFIIT